MPKKVKKGLGSSLIKAKSTGRRSRVFSSSNNHVSQSLTSQQHKLQSITARSDLDEFIASAQMAGRDFSANKEQLIVLDSTGVSSLPLSGHQTPQHVPIPKRPSWNKSTTAEELDAIEREDFLIWRKGLADIVSASQLAVTPFEKNLEVWRQLWRVVERSNLICLILDARNPLLFISQDLLNYATALGKKPLLILNKADLLSPTMREFWAKYMREGGIDFLFFSAMTENIVSTAELNSSDIFSKSKLIDLFKSFSTCSPFMVGFVGYPNVGKSSTLNLLIDNSHRAAVSATPGKTRHFQTMNLSDDLQLCDCPGLVFPNFSTSKSELVLSGVISIDTLRDFLSPVSLLCSRVSRTQLVSIYSTGVGIDLESNAPLDPHSFLQGYARLRGFMSSKGVPDESRVARLVLKDYVNGHLIFVHPPPNLSDEELSQFFSSLDGTAIIPNNVDDIAELKLQEKEVSEWVQMEDNKQLAPSRSSLRGNTKAKSRRRNQLKNSLPVKYPLHST